MKKRRFKKPVTKNPNTPAKKPRTAKKANIGTYRGVNYESNNELWCLQYLFELQDAGYISSIIRAEAFLLTEGLKNVFTEPNKRGTSSVTKEQVILKSSLYTPEYKVYFNKKGADKFVWVVGSNTKYDKPFIGHRGENGQVYIIIECKSDFDYQNMTRIFTNNKKFVWHIHRVFINLFQPNTIFEKTFTPKEFMRTSTGRERKIKYEPKTLQQFLNIKTNG